jgi:hypothetical protein
MIAPTLAHRARLSVVLYAVLTVVALGPGRMRAETKAQLFGADRITNIEIEAGQNGIARLDSEPRSYIPAVVRVDGQVFRVARVHLKGHGSFQPVTEKPNLMVRLDEGSGGKKAFGHNRLLLDNSSQDGSFLKWKLASELFLKAGLPAAQLNFSRVRLNDRDLGLYLLVEPTDKVFLTRHFGSSAGNLYEGSNIDVEDKLDLDSGNPATAQRDLQLLASACREPNLERRWEKLQSWTVRPGNAYRTPQRSAERAQDRILGVRQHELVHPSRESHRLVFLT